MSAFLDHISDGYIVMGCIGESHQPPDRVKSVGTPLAPPDLEYENFVGPEATMPRQKSSQFKLT